MSMVVPRPNSGAMSVVTRARQDFAALHEAVEVARRFALPEHPAQTAAVDVLRALGAAMEVSAWYDGVA